MASLQSDNTILVKLVALIEMACPDAGDHALQVIRTYQSDDDVTRESGALPFLITAEGQLRVLLVTTRGRQGWIVPKADLSGI